MALQNYKIWTADDEIDKENAGTIRHVDPQAAVEEFIETYDRNHTMSFVRKVKCLGSIIIFCEDVSGLGGITKWSLTVETIPAYYATEVK